ncbi:nicotinate-nucleotide pyrophosphorylase (carboxylating) [Candidatus Brocadiaceae bacterium]|nr:nicotinate-nucleotide pyrophosphorylase (carboxylating) [Candidatus Brocadiaceae bacterium]
MNLNFQLIDPLIQSALDEDIQSGDITTEATIPPDVPALGRFLIKQHGVLAGNEIVHRVFQLVDPALEYAIALHDGTGVEPGQVVATVSGSAASILRGERTALNFMQRMSGIATVTKSYLDLVKPYPVKIMDTRKTVPGLRALDKYAVTVGGGSNHRIGLYDMFLIKDNHIQVAGSVTNAIERCKLYRKEKGIDSRIEVEVTNFDELDEALHCGVDRIMLDNFSVEDLRKAVAVIAGRSEIEASGGITSETIHAVAATGVDIISVGALTHSVKGLDISLEVSIS